MPKKSPSAPTPEEQAAKLRLIRALSEAVSHEKRFGHLQGARVELDARWAHVVDAIKDVR